MNSDDSPDGPLVQTASVSGRQAVARAAITCCCAAAVVLASWWISATWGSPHADLRLQLLTWVPTAFITTDLGQRLFSGTTHPARRLALRILVMSLFVVTAATATGVGFLCPVVVGLLVSRLLHKAPYRSGLFTACACVLGGSLLVQVNAHLGWSQQIFTEATGDLTTAVLAVLAIIGMIDSYVLARERSAATAALLQEHKRRHEELLWAVMHDQLTGALSRQGLHHDLQARLAHLEPVIHRAHRSDPGTGLPSSGPGPVNDRLDERPDIENRGQDGPRARVRDRPAAGSIGDLLSQPVGSAQAEATDVGAGRGVGVIYLDLDGFKPVNDHHGHDVGDAVLSAVVDRFRSVVRADDSIARVGGDEFVIVLEAHALDDVRHLAAQLIAALTTPLDVTVETTGSGGDAGGGAGGGVLRLLLGVSAGAAFTTTRVSRDEILRAADQEMYKIKRGRAREPYRSRGGSSQTSEPPLSWIVPEPDAEGAQ